MLIDGCKTQTIQTQCSGMESEFQAIQVINITKKLDSTCYHCGFSYPHKDKLCPAHNATCNLCGKHGHFAKVSRSKVSSNKLNLAEVKGAWFFSKTDLAQMYHQLELAPESCHITTFTTHEGLYRY